MSDRPDHATIDPPIEPVAGYPIYDATSHGASSHRDELLARCEAGYLVVTGPERSPLGERGGAAADIVLAADGAAPQESSAPGNPDYRPDPAVENANSQGARGVPPPTAPPPPIVRQLFAKLANGETASQHVVGTDRSSVAGQIDEWRRTLQLDSAADASSSDVNPDPNAWTLLGGRGVKVNARGWFSPMYYNTDWAWYDTGVAEATVSLYRLNSGDAFDYFLVKMLWTVSPKNQRKDFGGIWFYNRDHKLQIALSAQTSGGLVNGDLINFEPKTVPTSQTYEVKFGGDLTAKIAKEPEAGGTVSAEIATKFTIPSVSTNATTDAPRVTWQLQHDYGPAWGRGVGDNWPNTTISGATAVTWALYRFSSAINAGSAPEMKVDVRLTGNFGSSAEKAWLAKQVLELGYQHETQTLRYPVPTIGYEPVYTPERPLQLAPGRTAAVQIRAGAPGLPLQWKAYGIPKDKDGREYLIVSPASRSLGDGTLQITAASFAEPGTVGYLRVNSVPATATDSLRKGGLDIPVRIIAG